MEKVTIPTYYAFIHILLIVYCIKYIHFKLIILILQIILPFLYPQSFLFRSTQQFGQFAVLIVPISFRPYCILQACTLFSFAHFSFMHFIGFHLCGSTFLGYDPSIQIFFLVLPFFLIPLDGRVDMFP